MCKFFALFLLLSLCACGEPGSTFCDGHYRPTAVCREKQIERIIEKHDREKEQRENQ